MSPPESRLFNGCAITRVDPLARAPASAQFQEADGWQRAAGGAVVVPTDWWTVFRDPVLDDLQRRLVIGNENFKASAVNSATSSWEIDLWGRLGQAVTGARAAIAVLLGVAPSSFSIASTAIFPSTDDVPVALPAILLERRPDIAGRWEPFDGSTAVSGATRMRGFNTDDH